MKRQLTTRILGAGVAGLTIAIALASDGHDVELIGEGGAARSHGVMVLRGTPPPEAPLEVSESWGGRRLFGITPLAGHTGDHWRRRSAHRPTSGRRCAPARWVAHCRPGMAAGFGVDAPPRDGRPSTRAARPRGGGAGNAGARGAGRLS
ncbi:NAD(P)/FAD-dependent oxidoreductase [Brachybacterium sp. p3-SID957]|uniref:NAD(P)/FAD-dependent oxidoreductase n=1 Tax=Brachybacterium sp. p3-SID957 TaxID=2916049 RepID=UPI00223AF1CA|nr:NAD(P)/FAD-dependent oxidoreductase [Brachybacterium sp. p3-SID957]MCT1776563.1 NAD(P)/FAD-dependent oxidoreductase [Brachybacterium sp. p3-SID957]